MIYEKFKRPKPECHISTADTQDKPDLCSMLPTGQPTNISITES